METVIIIGAGASGLACASTLSRSNKNLKIIVLEQFSRSARKLLATGNGRCNLSNRNLTSDSYNTQDQRIQHLVTSFDIVHYFSELGLLTKYEGDLLYPFSNQAATVKKVLLDSLKNVSIIEDCKALEVVKKQEGYLVKTTQQEYLTKYLVYATGSKAYRLSGEDNLKIVEDLGLQIKDTYPSLVQLQTKPAYPMLKGVRVKAKVSLLGKHEVLDTKDGELLFTETGVSGICVMQLSRWYHRYQKPMYLEIDMLPMYTSEEWKQLCKQRQETFQSQYLSGIFNAKLADILVKHKISPKKFQLEVIGTNDYTKAQVMSGGLELEEVNENLECKKYPNFFVIGEALDVDGDCGGFNLHFAFASGNHVAKIISQKAEKNVKN